MASGLSPQPQYNKAAHAEIFILFHIYCCSGRVRGAREGGLGFQDGYVYGIGRREGRQETGVTLLPSFRFASARFFFPPDRNQHIRTVYTLRNSIKMSSDREREWERERELQQAHYHAREWERQRERERERIREGERDRDRDRERRRSERAGVARPEASQQQYQQLAGREEQVPQRRAKGPGGERVARERSTGERVAVERSTRERERERARESDREGQRERERESGRERRQSTRERSDPARRESRSNPPAPPRPPAAVGGASRRESTRDPDRRHSRRDREAGGSDSRRETVRLVAREADPEAEVDGGGLKRGGTRRNQSQSHRRSQSTRERNRNREHAAGLGAVSGGEAGMDRTKSGRERPHRERSRRERATAPGGYFPVAVPNADADSYDGRQAEMRARYKPVPQDIAPPPPAVAPITVGWDGGGDGTGDLEKGSGGGDKAALLDKRLSTSSGIGSHLKKKSRKKRRCHPCLWVLLLIAILLIIILVPVGVLVVGREKSQDENAQRDAEAKSERESGLDNINRTSIPVWLISYPLFFLFFFWWMLANRSYGGRMRRKARTMILLTGMIRRISIVHIQLRWWVSCL